MKLVTAPILFASLLSLLLCADVVWSNEKSTLIFSLSKNYVPTRYGEKKAAQSQTELAGQEMIDHDYPKDDTFLEVGVGGGA